MSDLCEVEDFHESLQLEEYIALCRQDIAIDITIAEMACLHTLLLKYKEDIVSQLNILLEPATIRVLYRKPSIFY